MKIAHFDVDPELDKILKGEKYSYTLQNLDPKAKYFTYPAITIKTGSTAGVSELSKFPTLKLLITRTVGVDHIDLEYCKKNNIAVYHIEDYGAFNIAEHTFALLLAGSRNILTSQKDVKKGNFSYQSHIGIALKGKTLGIVGTGKIGLEVISRAISFGMKVIAYDVYKNAEASKRLGFTYVTLPKLAKTSDIISLHAPLLPETKHMIGAPEMKLMKDGVILINTGRGGLIDTKALVHYANKFRFIGLDVLEDEQLFSKKHPLLTFENVIITPHMAFFSDESVKIIAAETVELIKRFNREDKKGKIV